MNNYAIFQIGGKQYRGTVGDTFRVEKLDGEGSINFQEVMMITDGHQRIFGTPFIDSAYVKADIVEQGKGKKVLVFKQKPRKNHRKLRGHRQLYTLIKIREIVTGREQWHTRKESEAHETDVTASQSDLD
jgi:large subunit ribosomal protein L21